MVRRLSAVGALVAVVFGVFIMSNPALADDDHVAPGPPPPVPYDVAPAPPGGGYVWVAGHWYYRPTGWIWAPVIGKSLPIQELCGCRAVGCIDRMGGSGCPAIGRGMQRSFRVHPLHHESRSSWRLHSSARCGSEDPGGGSAGGFGFPGVRRRRPGGGRFGYRGIGHAVLVVGCGLPVIGGRLGAPASGVAAL